MSFLIDDIHFYHFRNYEEYSFAPSKSLTVFIGDNAVGKTNIIEGLQLLTTGDSFRNPTPRELISWGSEDAKISFHAIDGPRELDTVVMFNDKKSFTLNGKKKRLSEMKGTVPSVLFTPDDLDMVKGAPEVRRTAIDDIGTQLSQTYFSLKTGYDKVVRQRNLLLRDETVSDDLLTSWTESLISLGVRFFDHRVSLFERIKQSFLKIYEYLVSGHETDILYIPSWQRFKILDDGSSEYMMRKALSLAAVEEKGRMTSLIGPHRDEISFLIDGKDARTFGSQGQQRILVLAWKLAEVETIENISGKVPVLLLDDVMSELDGVRRNALTEFIMGKTEGEPVSRPQTFITTTDSSYFMDELLSEAEVIHLGK